MLLERFFDDHYRPLRLLGKSEQTVRLYRFSINAFAKTLQRRPTLADLTDANLSKHIQRVLDNGRSVATANKDRAQLMTLWRLASQLGKVKSWPTLPPLVEPERTPVAWMHDECEQLLGAIDRQEGYFCDVPRALWWKTMVMVCLDTGERISAVRDMQWTWFRDEWLHVPAEARKGKRRDRAYRLSGETIGHLEAVKIVSPKKPFPWPYCRMYLWVLYKQLLQDAGLPCGRRDKFHKLRRTTGSVAHAAGMNVQEVLDHQYKRTSDRYVDPRYKPDRSASDAIAAFLRDPSKSQSPSDRRSGTDRRQTG